MAEPFFGEIKMVGFNFAPRGWAFCDGQLLPISQNSALFSLLGTIYGGDGRTTFALPDLRGRAPVGEGNGPGLSNRRLGSKGGAETATLTINEIPTHSHTISAQNVSGQTQATSVRTTGNLLASSSNGDTSTPSSAKGVAASVADAGSFAGSASALATSATDKISGAVTDINVNIPASTLPISIPELPTNNIGGGQSHNNMQPYLAVNFIIATQGIYPSRD